MEKPRLMADPDGSGWSRECPKIWRTEDGRYWLQGRRASAELLAALALPDDDFVVELDTRLIGWTPAE